MVPRSGWKKCLLRFLRKQAEKFRKHKKAETRREAQTSFDPDDSREWRRTMSAALTLPYVWATACDLSAQRECDTFTEGVQFYRRRTENLLQRYLRASLAVGRVASIAEDVTLRGRATNSRMKNFEDVVIFTIDVEKCLRVLDPQELKLVVKIALQEYMFMDVAEQLQQHPRTIARNYWKALDRLTMEFLKRNLLVEYSLQPCQDRQERS